MRNKDKIKESMINLAIEMYGDITPPSNKATLYSSFTKDRKDELILWFNTLDKSTHIIRENMIGKKND